MMRAKRLRKMSILKITKSRLNKYIKTVHTQSEIKCAAGNIFLLKFVAILETLIIIENTI